MAHVQSRGAFFSGDGGTLDFSSNVTAGNLIVVSVHEYNGSASGVPAITDNLGNTYNPLISQTGGDGNLRLTIKYAYNVSGSACTVTVNPAGTSAYLTLAIHEFSEIIATDPIDQFDPNTGTGVDVSGGPVTTQQAAELLFAAMTSMAESQVSIAPDADYTQMVEYENGATETHTNTMYRIVSSTLTDTANWTLGSSLGWIGGIATFKAISAGTNISVSDSGSGTDAVSVSKVTNKSLAESGFGNDTFEYSRSLPSGSFPTARLLDDFNRASLGSKWTITQGNAGISNNKFVGLSSGTSIAVFNPATFGPEMELFCTVGNLSTGNYPAVNIDYDYVSPTQYRAVGVESIHNNGTRIFVYRTPPSVFLIDTNISYPSGTSIRFGVRHQINGDITLYFDPGTGWNAVGKANDLVAFSSGSVQLEIGDFDDVSGLVPTITVDDLYGGTLNYSPIMVSGSVSDTGRGTESLTLSATLSISDTGLGTDQVTLLQALFKTITDIATALDATVIQASSFTTDSVTGQDVLTIQARFILSDAVAGIDSPSVASSLGITDGALGGDFLDLLASLSVLENGAGSDIPTSSVYVITVDVGTGTEGLVITSTVISGTTAWGQITGVLEDNIRTYANNWAGTGVISGSGDNEQICLASGQYMVSEVVYTGIASVVLLQNEYASGDTVLLRYRHGATEADCLNASWNNYSSAFSSLGYVQVRIESTL